MIDEYINERIKKLEKLRDLGINPYPQIVLKSKKSSEELIKKYAKIGEKKSKIAEEFAGRIIGFRSMGNIAFAHLQDEYGRIQAVFQSKETKKYELLKLLDVGDILIVKGNFFKTKKGEISISAKEFTLASKSIRPLPEKFHGLIDEELKLRKREVDAIMNPEILEKFRKKSKIVKLIREFLDNNGFLEVQTPVLQTIYGGASAEPFITYHNAQDMKLYLRIAPEIYLKRMITAGFEKIYELGNKYRNEGMDKSHLQEIIDLEFYWAYQDYEGLMKFTEKLISYVLLKSNNSLKLNYQGITLDFTPPYKRITFRELLIEHTGIDIDVFKDYASLKKEILRKKIKGVDPNGPKHYGALLDELYKRTARQKIIQPTFMTDYPVEMIPLAKMKESDSSKISSFQLLVNTWEIIKAYNELNNPLDQRKRFIEQQEFMKLGDKEAHLLDEEFLQSLEYGMPPVAGWGLGLARFCMMIMDEASIRESVFFPLMKPEN
ncbi:MAG: lysine--tRNA ligase [Candidatus Nanoarchaeia archaeon]|nr:lysine--tRNA ligase [Candidatus Nanoarchaeia archaeon]MDD5054436.1 lysine--tRNA ligase [Candidatus Nanoarchaeia archaeon]MDD5499358.1 lysine--tRNA ligase [Candidatus Nanoarchaeia archaeon]